VSDAAENLLSDDEPLNLRRALADGAELGVAPVFFGWVIFRVAVAAVNLYGLLADPDGDLRGVELRHRRLFSHLLPRVLQSRCAVGQKARGVYLRRHVCELELDGLKLGDGLAELFALLRVAHRRLVSALRDAECERRNRDAPAVQDLDRKR